MMARTYTRLWACGVGLHAACPAEIPRAGVSCACSCHEAHAEETHGL